MGCADGPEMFHRKEEETKRKPRGEGKERQIANFLILDI